MSSPSRLLHLPNELFESIFIYLSPFDLIRAFLPIRHSRLHALIEPYINHLDLTTIGNANGWSDSLCYIVKSLRCPGVCLPEKLNDCTQLTHIELTFIPSRTKNGEYDQIINVLNGIGCLRSISIVGYSLTQIYTIQPWTLIRCLNVELNGASLFHKLFENLPCLEELRVKFNDTNARDMELPKHCPERLCTLKIERLNVLQNDEQLIRVLRRCALSLEYLSLDLDYITDPNFVLRMNDKWISGMNQLKKFEFHFHYHAGQFVDINTIDIPVVAWGILQLASFPYTLNHVRLNTSIDFRTNTNQHPLMPFTSVRFVKLHSCLGKTSTDLYRFIQKMFPYVRRLQVYFQMLSLFNKEMLEDSTIVLSTVKQLEFYWICSTPSLPCLKRLFLLVPNIEQLEMHSHNIYCAIRDSDDLASMRARIRTLYYRDVRYDAQDAWKNFTPNWLT